jgi:hypothetical protein
MEIVIRLVANIWKFSLITLVERLILNDIVLTQVVLYVLQRLMVALHVVE